MLFKTQIDGASYWQTCGCTMMYSYRLRLYEQFLISVCKQDYACTVYAQDSSHEQLILYSSFMRSTFSDTTIQDTIQVDSNNINRPQTAPVEFNMAEEEEQPLVLREAPDVLWPVDFDPQKAVEAIELLDAICEEKSLETKRRKVWKRGFFKL